MTTSLPAPVSDDLWQRSLQYAEKKSLVIDRQRYFGFGSDGCVWRALAAPPATETAVKVFEQNYESERDAYLRLRDWGVVDIHGFRVPSLLDYDDDLQVVEMEIVSPPFIVDFGKSHVDIPPYYYDSTEDRERFEAEYAELFTAKEWPKVRSILSTLEHKYGIYYVDPRPGNIAFAEDDE
jgi:hypothetical protein